MEIFIVLVFSHLQWGLKGAQRRFARQRELGQGDYTDQETRQIEKGS